jgi:hypothetical protein
MMNASRFAIGPLLVRSSRYLPLITGSAVLVVSIALTTTTAHAQRPSFGGRSSGGRSSDGDSNDRREQMQSFFMRMREQQGGGDSNDRREQMQSFFSRMREQRGGDTGGDSRGGSRGGGREGSSRSRSSRQPQKPKPKPRITVDLPEQYVSQDLDKDGQLGLYEWYKSQPSAIAQFRSLDANSDGFLTPRELLATPTDTSTVAVSTDSASATASAAPASTTVSVSTTTAAQPTTAAASKKSASAIRIAKFTFRALDKDKDGKITAEEWSKSSRTRAQFAKSKVTLKLPADEASFVAAYPAPARR